MTTRSLAALRFLPMMILVLSCARNNAQEAAREPAQSTAQDTVEATAERRPDVVFVPTPYPVVEAMLAVAKVGKNDVLYDLGSGDGRIVIAAARKFGTRAIGIDIDPKRISESRENADTARVAKVVEFRQADLFTTDLRSASVVTLYLLPELNVRLRPKLFAELRPGSRVVSHSFDMGDWKADSLFQVDSRFVYYWLMPANVAGRWNITTASGQAYDVRLDQQYQVITGSQVMSPPGVQIDSAIVRGDSIRFVLRGATDAARRMVFRGRVDSNSMSGAFVDAAGASRTWRASRRQ